LNRIAEGKLAKGPATDQLLKGIIHMPDISSPYIRGRGASTYRLQRERIERPENIDFQGAPDDVINKPSYWQLERQEKYSTSGVVRSVHPTTTIRRASAVMSAAGITVISNVTRLDRLGIPNFMSVRPADLGPGISYYNGKGTTIPDAHAGALMEAIERHGGECCDYAAVVGSYNEMKSNKECVSPAEIVVPLIGSYADDLPLQWVCGFDVLRQRPTWVPLNCVISPYNAASGANLFFSSSNGLASGNTLTEALCHAICEVVERDTESICLARSRLAPRVQDLVSPNAVRRYEASQERTIDLDSLPPRARGLVRKIVANGLDVTLSDMTDEMGIATIHCTITDPAWAGSANSHGGCGCHPDARVALLRALTEAAQSRLTCIQGGREDLEEIMEDKTRVTAHHIAIRAKGKKMISFRAIPTVENDYIDDDLRYLFDRLPRAGLTQVVAFDLTRPEVGVPVVRVVVPNAETWAVFRVHTGRGRLGRRVRRILQNA
jgi:YcaO-like protein with predicted kinase domain